ncbi:hypothetical protein [Corynebacterium heidelbergense]|uniref:Uncharacterized protein n=1 Tax=Corynebacterium heidelbergense TaxID=2055947 RepID=A0A364V5E0_9CORY|nr:hypothetical protein [Corynebacterium heidelbergense]RAV31870.1 hypothetical protein DLJ54_06055 [Corynebacterium heidelbergense]
MRLKLMRLAALVWVTLIAGGCVVLVVLFMRSEDRLFGVTFSIGSVGLSAVFLSFPAKLTPKVITPRSEKITQGASSLVVVNRWLDLQISLGLLLVQPAVIAMYFDPAMRLNRSDLFHLVASLSAFAGSVWLVLHLMWLRPYITRFEFKDQELIFDLGCRDRRCISVRFESLEFLQRWSGNTIQVIGATVTYWSRPMFSNKVKVDDSIGGLKSIPGSWKSARSWKPFLSAETLETIESFYASRQSLPVQTH